ncbi:MAG TPA: topology modulation protein [Allosphingosinicella sp.]|jgi:adenylate kinase family enzyme
MVTMHRIMIIGQPGSGKSTLARTLGDLTGLPVIHIDKIHWRPGWVERSKAEKTRLCREVEQQSRWIFEGGHSATWASRVARADMLIVLDRPVGLRLWRVVHRAFTGLGKTRPDMAEGCPERLRSLPEFIRYIWMTRHLNRRKMYALAATAPQGCEVVHLRSDDEVKLFLKSAPAHLATLEGRD